MLKQTPVRRMGQISPCEQIEYSLNMYTVDVRLCDAFQFLPLVCTWFVKIVRLAGMSRSALYFGNRIQFNTIRISCFSSKTKFVKVCKTKSGSSSILAEKAKLRKIVKVYKRS